MIEDNYPYYERNFWKKTLNIPYWWHWYHEGYIRHFHIDHNTPFLSPNILHNQLHIYSRYRVHKKKIWPVFKDFSRTTFDFQGSPDRELISQIVQKFTFPIHTNRTLRLELIIHQLLYTFQFTCLKLIVNYCIKQKSALCKLITFTNATSPSYDLYSVFDNQKASKNTLKATTFQIEENLKTLKRLAQQFKDFSRTSPKIQGLFKAVRTVSVL